MSVLRRYFPILTWGAEYSGGSHSLEGSRHE
jgi:hypothetical protein